MAADLGSGWRERTVNRCIGRGPGGTGPTLRPARRRAGTLNKNFSRYRARRDRRPRGAPPDPPRARASRRVDGHREPLDRRTPDVRRAVGPRPAPVRPARRPPRRDLRAG
jgi:hypothetical protein